MGQTESKTCYPEVTKIKFDLMCQNTFYHAQLQRDRKIAELQKKEQGLKQLIKANKNGANKESISMECSNCIGLVNYIKGTNSVLNQIKMLNENSLDIVNHLNRKQSMNIQQLIPHIHTIIWSTSRLNLSQIKEFSDFISMYMGRNIYNDAESSPHVDLSLKRLFVSVTAGPLEIQDYIETFCKRNELSEDLISGMWDQPRYPPANPFGGGYPQQNPFPQPPYQQGPFPQGPAGGYPPIHNPYINQQPGPIPTGPQGCPQDFNSATFQVNPAMGGGFPSPQPNHVTGSAPVNSMTGGSQQPPRPNNLGSDLNSRLQELRRIGA